MYKFAPMKITSFIFCLLCCLSCLSAQDGNPFEISSRKEIKKDSISTDIDTIQMKSSASNGNPFQIHRSTETKPSTPRKEKKENVFDIKRTHPIVDTSKKAEKKVIKKWKIQEDRNELFIVMMGVLLLFSIIITLFRVELQKIFKACLSNNMARSLAEVKAENFFVASRIWYIFFFFMATLFTYQLSNHFGWIPKGIEFWTWISILFIGISLLFISKNIVIRLVGVIFPLRKQSEEYFLTSMFFSIVIGVGLLPINLLLAFGLSGMKNTVIIISLILLILFYIYKYFRGLLIASSVVIQNKFHFFIYICAVETAPTIILLKLFLDYIDA